MVEGFYLEVALVLDQKVDVHFYDEFLEHGVVQLLADLRDEQLVFLHFQQSHHNDHGFVLKLDEPGVGHRVLALQALLDFGEVEVEGFFRDFSGELELHELRLVLDGDFLADFVFVGVSVESPGEDFGDVGDQVELDEALLVLEAGPLEHLDQEVDAQRAELEGFFERVQRALLEQDADHVQEVMLFAEVRLDAEVVLQLFEVAFAHALQEQDDLLDDLQVVVVSEALDELGVFDHARAE